MRNSPLPLPRVILSISFSRQTGMWIRVQAKAWPCRQFFANNRLFSCLEFDLLVASLNFDRASIEYPKFLLSFFLPTGLGLTLENSPFLPSSFFFPPLGSDHFISSFLFLTLCRISLSPGEGKDNSLKKKSLKKAFFLFT